MAQEILTGLAVLRAIPLAFLMVYSVRHRDKLALAIAVLWGLVLVVGTFMDNREASQIIASPLVVLVVWHIVRSQRK